MALALGALGAFSWPQRDAHAGPALKEVVFAPHRAIYDLSLDNAQSGSGVSGVNGRIVYELSGNACEGYAQSMRFVTYVVNQEGNSVLRYDGVTGEFMDAVVPAGQQDLNAPTRLLFTGNQILLTSHLNNKIFRYEFSHWAMFDVTLSEASPSPT